MKDKFGRNKFVLETFVKHGAPEEILYENKPHIGTDLLRNVVAGIREEIKSLGGDVRFEAKVTDFVIKDGKLTGLIINDEEELKTEAAILAPGHSARDTFKVLSDRNLEMHPKAFAIGLRVEHPREMIDHSQYGEGADKYNLLSDILQTDLSCRQWKKCIFFLHVSRRFCCQRIFRTRTINC